MSFKNIIGQSKIIEILKNQIKTNRLPHSYIFVGPEGVGKKKTALELAKTLNCQNRSNTDSCDICNSCIKINKGLHPDVCIIDFNWQSIILDEPLPKSGKNIIKIDTIREMQKKIALKPLEGYYKVFIIESADKLNIDSANCLLKTLEEPPSNSLIILLTDILESLPKTIISRCQQLKFRALADELIMDYLINEFNLDKAETEKIIKFCEGSLGKAIFIKETSNELYGINTVLNLWNKLKMKECKSEELLEFSNILSENHYDVEQFIMNLLCLAREELINKKNIDDNTKDLSKIIEFILNCKNSLRYNINLNLFVSFLLLKLNDFFNNKELNYGCSG